MRHLETQDKDGKDPLVSAIRIEFEDHCSAFVVRESVRLRGEVSLVVKL